MKRILRDKYIPTLQDILYIRKPTIGVIEHIFRMDNLVYRYTISKGFFKKDPLSLNQLATQVLQNGMDNNKIGSHSVPPSLHSKYQPMPEITISVPGIIKLLCNLNPSKASGPDSIKPIVLKNLSNEIALFLSVLRNH